MKKIIALMVFCGSVMLSAQKYYTKINSSKINHERVKVSEQFFKEFLRKCAEKDFSKFENFILDKTFERKLFSEFENRCIGMEEWIGRINIKDFNSAYLNDYSKNNDPLELIIFDADFEKKQSLKYLSILIFRDQNVISGMVITEQKPISKYKPKKESAL